MREKLIRKILQYGFTIRYWIIFILFGGLVWATWWVSKQPTIEIRDTVAVFAGGLVFITLFYHFLNYEYNQNKFKHDVKSSKDLLSWNTAMEWQKEFLTKNANTLYKFYSKNKKYLDDGRPKKFQDELEKPENDDYYSAVLTVNNYMESVCLGVKQGIMDEDFIKGFFKTVFIGHYNRYIYYIEYLRRQQGNTKIWNNFTDLTNKWITCN